MSCEKISSDFEEALLNALREGFKEKISEKSVVIHQTGGVGGLFAKQLYDALDVHKITNRLALDGRFSTNARLQTSDLGTRLLCKNEYQMRTISAIWSQPLNIHSWPVRHHLLDTKGPDNSIFSTSGLYIVY